MIVKTSIGGRGARLELANTFGTDRLKIGALHVALRQAGSAIARGSDHVVTFGGRGTITIPPGATVLSDPLAAAVPALAELAITLYIPEASGPQTFHPSSRRTAYISGPGDFTYAVDFPVAATTEAWYFLTGVHVLAPADTGLIVALGDSITNGDGSRLDGGAAWPSQLTERFHAAGITNLAVVNAGISGNALLTYQGGTSALARFDHDVLGQPGVKYLVFLEGINDILPEWAYADRVTPEEIVQVYEQIIERAHVYGIKVIGATLTPYGGASYFRQSAEDVRLAVNRWLRTTKRLDGLIDFEAAVRDPKHPDRLRADLTDDQLHPNDAGYQEMANAIHLSLFGPAN